MNELENIKQVWSVWNSARREEEAARIAASNAKKALEKATNYQDCSVLIGETVLYFDEVGKIYRWEVPNIIITNDREKE